MNMEDKLIYYYTGLGWNDDPCDAETRIAVVTTGFGCAICGGWRQRIEGGDVLLLPRDHHIRIEGDCGKEPNVVYIRFQAWAYREESDETGNGKRRPQLEPVEPTWFGPDVTILKALFPAIGITDRLLALSEGKSGSGYDLEKQAALHELLLFIYRSRSRGVPAVPSDWIGNALDYIESHYHQEDLNRENVARAVGVSPDYMSRRMKEVTGLSFTEHLSGARIRKAQELLLEGRSNLQRIAAETGYTDSHYLSRRFKQAVGVSPTCYIRKPKTILSLEPVCSSMLLTLDVAPVAANVDEWMVGHFGRQITNKRVYTYRDDIDEERKRNLAETADVQIGFKETSFSERTGRYTPFVRIDWRRFDWKEQFVLIGDLVNKRKEAVEWLERYSEYAQQCKERIRRSIGDSETFAVVSFEHPDLERGKAKLLGVQFGRGGHVLYQSLQAASSHLFDREILHGEGWLDIPFTELERYAAADRIIVIRDPRYRLSPHPNTTDAYSHPAWVSIIQRANGVYEFDFEHYHFDPAATLIQLNTMTRRLSAELSTK